MSCKVKSSTIDYLKAQGAVTERRVIANPSLFEELNEELTKLAREKYNVGDGKTKLFTATWRYNTRLDGSTSRRYVYEANNELFDLLDEAVANYREQSKPSTASEAVVVKEPKQRYRKDPDTSAKWFRGTRSTTASKALKDIAESNSPFAPLAKELSTKLVRDTTIDLVDDIPSTYRASNPNGTYFRDTGAIHIKATGLFPNGQSEAVILHEILHHLTASKLNDFSDPKVKLFDKLRDHALQHLKVEDFYALTNLDEFAVGLFTDPAFITALKEIPPIETDQKHTNFLEQIMNYLLDLLGLGKQESLYEQTYSLVSSIIEDNRQSEINRETSLAEFNRNLPPLYSSVATMDKSKKVEDALDPKEGEKLTAQEETELTKVMNEHKLEDKVIHLRTIDEKLTHTLELINKSININLEKYDNLVKIYASRDPKKSDNMQEYKTSLQVLQSEINEFEDAERLKAIVMFVEKMIGNMTYVKNRLDNTDYSDPKDVFYTVKNYDAYLKAYGVIEDIKDNIASIREDSKQDILDKEELEEIESKILEAETQYSYLKVRVHKMMKNYMREFLKDIKYFPRVETKHRDRLRKEHRLNKISEPVDTWISRQMLNRDKALIEKDLEDAINNLLEDHSFDISGATTLLNSSINTSSTMVQIYEQLFTELKNKRMEVERAKDREFKELFEEIVKAKGTNNIKTLYKNILEKDKDGRWYIKGDYSIDFLEIRDKRNAIKREMQEAREQDGALSERFKKAREALSDLEKEHFTTKDGKLVPKEKWKNDLSGLSEIELKMLNFFRDITEESRKNTYGQRSLVKYVGSAKFYELPKVTKSTAERVWTGSAKGIFEDFKKDFTERRPDDYGYREANVDGGNNPLNTLPIHYRDSHKHPMPSNQQSLDLMTIYRLEFKNGVTYRLRSDMELEFNMLTEIAKNKRYYATQGTTRNLDRRTGKLTTKEGHDSNVYKMMQNMMEARLYDTLHRTGNKIGKVDLNKAVGFINGITSFLGMSFNIAAGTANVVNANAQMFLESFIKGHFITAAGIKKANKIYAENLSETLKDNLRPIKNSFVSQINELFDVKGLFNLSEADFMSSDLLKAGVSRQSLQVFQNSGENWISSVITMAVLDGVKVMDKNSNYINKDGNIVKTKEEAASLLDMMERDDKGMLKVSDKVVYTTHSRMVEWNNGGKEKVDMLVKKKLFDSIGNYTQDAQPEIQRHWWGKLVMMYRKYLVPMGVARFRGIEYVNKKTEDLDEGQQRFSYALQENEEGTYTSLARFLIQSLKDKRVFINGIENWNELSDYEKHNIKRAVTELVVSFAMIPLVLMALQGIADSDDELLWFAMYQLRRLDSELSQYRSVTEAFKVMRSPIPSTRILEVAGETVTNMFNPTAVYESGDFKGKNKMLIRLGKQTPVLKDLLRSYQNLYEFQDSSWGTRM